MARLYKVGGTLSSRGVEFVVVPIGHIVFDVGGDAVHFGLVADDAVVETRLPGEILVGLVGVARDESMNTIKCKWLGMMTYCGISA